MPRRLPTSSAFFLAFLLPALALADVPPADGGNGGSATTTDGGSVNAACTVANQSIAGTSCAACEVTSSDTNCALELGDSYGFACQQSATVQVWCTGPSRNGFPGPGCSLAGMPPRTPAVPAALCALVGLAAWSLRRRSSR